MKTKLEWNFIALAIKKNSAMGSRGGGKIKLKQKKKERRNKTKKYSSFKHKSAQPASAQSPSFKGKPHKKKLPKV